MDLIHAAMAREKLLRLCTANVCWRSAHIALPDDEVSPGDADEVLEGDGLLADELVLEDEPDVDVPSETSVATAGPGKMYD